MNGRILSRAQLISHRSRAQSVATLLARDAERDKGHALIWSLFPQDQKDRDFLFRQTGPREFLILSQTAPSDTLGLWEIHSREYAPELVAGDALAFSLLADVQISTAPRGDGPIRKRGAREPLHKAAKRMETTPEALAHDWLSGQLSSHGARLRTIPKDDDLARDPDIMDAAPRERLNIRLEPRQRMRGTSRSGFLQAVLFKGALDVTDPAAFSDLLFSGLGRSRAYGCGLLLIRRL